MVKNKNLIKNSGQHKLSDEIKSILHHFKRAFKFHIFLESESPTLKKQTD